GAVTEHERRQTVLARFHQRDESRHVADVVVELLDVEALAVRAAAAAQIDRVRRQAVGRQLIRHPLVIAAVRVEAGNDRHYAARRLRRRPRSEEDVEPGDVGEVVLSRGTRPKLRHDDLPGSQVASRAAGWRTLPPGGATGKPRMPLKQGPLVSWRVAVRWGDS